MHLLVTGATGFLGSNLVRRLLKDGHRISVLKRQRSKLDRLQSCLPEIDSFDIEDGFEAAFATGTIEGVIHLATCYGRNAESAADILATNTLFPLQLLEAALQAQVGLFVSTDTGLDRNLNPYSLSKRQFAEWGRLLIRHSNMQFVNVRLEHVYGPDDDNSKFTAYVIRTLMHNAEEVNLTKGEQIRDFIYLDDVLSAYELLISHFEAQQISGYVECGLGSANPVKIKDFVELVKELTAAQTKLNFGAVPYRAEEVMYTKADISYLEALGWQCHTSLQAGIQKVITSETRQ